MTTALDPGRVRFSLVLGGGGLKGFAHLGVMRALEERGLAQSVIAGTSIGALIGGAVATGTTREALEATARGLARRDLFQINRVKILLDRMRTPSVYSAEPLVALIAKLVGDIRFDEARIPLLVNTVDVETGFQVIWGLSGQRDVAVRDAIYASCALPGAFPPGVVGGHVCVDGGAADNLPVTIADQDMELVVAVDVGSTDLTREDGIASRGFFDISMRAAQITMAALQREQLDKWTTPPMLLIRPRVNHVGWFEFGHAGFLIDEGYRAAREALDHLETALASPAGIFPRRVMEVDVERERCCGCRMCTVLAPGLFVMDAQGKAMIRERVLHWSPADGAFVRQCPTGAITARRVERRVSGTMDAIPAVGAPRP
ncbi:MAG: patatin-like phospholipase family protein [Gemmatimonadetes bacterium]|nr:patatin-like phospholipase family protein [Gemmatimonadota bacterium]